jgi:hypothetical protein
LLTETELTSLNGQDLPNVAGLELIPGIGGRINDFPDFFHGADLLSRAVIDGSVVSSMSDFWASSRMGR